METDLNNIYIYIVIHINRIYIKNNYLKKIFNYTSQAYNSSINY